MSYTVYVWQLATTMYLRELIICFQRYQEEVRGAEPGRRGLRRGVRRADARLHGGYCRLQGEVEGRDR